MASVAPLGRISLKSVARLPLEQVNHFEAGGRKMFVPLVGFNILYRFGPGDGHASASLLVLSDADHGPLAAGTRSLSGDAAASISASRTRRAV